MYRLHFSDAYFSNGLTETRMTRKYFHFFSSMFESWSFAVVHNNSWFPHKQHISINFYTVFVNKRYRAMRQNLKSRILKKKLEMWEELQMLFLFFAGIDTASA